jgi:beta-glucosidase
VTGPGAQHTIADPTNEASTGFVDRDAINPLQQLRALSGRADTFTYVPANDPVGQTVPRTALSTSDTTVTGGLSRTTGPGSPSRDSAVDFTTATHHQLAPGSYTWTGYLYVPTTDTYTFELQQSSGVAVANATLSLDGTAVSLANASNVYGASVPGTPTNAGYTEALLTNRQSTAGTLTGGSYHALTITFTNDTTAPASFRFAYSRANGDVADAAAAAKGKKAAVVFLNDSGATTSIPNPYGTTPATITGVASLSAANTNLVDAVAAANPNTIVVLNTTNPVLLPWIGNVRSVLEMWFSGQEGGTSTARLLLGQANPSGHTPLTWPTNATDTMWAFNQTVPLYPGDTTGPHLERLNGLPGNATSETEGIYAGYRYFDQQGITPQLPFGYGLSYTRFRYSHLTVTPTNGAADVSFDLTNTGPVAGSEVAQVYVGAGPEVPGVQQAVRSLRGFDRVTLQPGQTRHEIIHLDQRSFQYWSDAGQRWATNDGRRTIWVGDADSAGSLPLSATVAPLKSTAGEVADLVTMVRGLGRDDALAARVDAIQAAVAGGRNLDRAVEAFRHEVRAQTPGRISPATAAALLAQADRIQATQRR